MTINEYMTNILNHFSDTVINKLHKDKLRKWTCVSEILLVIEMNLQKEELIAIVVAYGCNEDQTTGNKKLFLS